MRIARNELPPDYNVHMEDPVCRCSPYEPIIDVQRDELRLNRRCYACVESKVAQSKKRAANDAKDWQETVKGGSAFGVRRDEVLKVPESYGKMRDGHLSQISEVEHSIDLASDA